MVAFNEMAFSFVQGYLKHRENCERDVGNSVTFNQPSGGHSCQSLLAISCTHTVHTYVPLVVITEQTGWAQKEYQVNVVNAATRSARYL